MTDNRLEKIAAPGRVALVTGAGLGIGRALARSLAARGMRVIATDTDAGELARTAEGVAGIETRVLDVTDSAALAALAAELGRVDMLVNNAVSRAGHGIDAPLEEWRKAMEVNVWAPVAHVRAFLPAMDDGMIVNLGSKQGITNPPGHTVYNMTKAALKSYTEALAHDLRQKGSQVTAHLLIPGWTTTGHAEPKPGAWAPQQVVERLFKGLANGDFYILCPDGEVTEEMDRARILWGARDITENRPALSRWHPDWARKARDEGL